MEKVTHKGKFPFRIVAYSLRGIIHKELAKVEEGLFSAN